MDMNENIYEFKVMQSDGKKISLEEYRGKVLLIVNTASKCGFTPQYSGLQKLYMQFRDSGFAVLAFPCNQFASQEPDDNASIQTFCTVNYGVTFPVFAKIAVNGKNSDPLFKYLKKNAPGFITNSIKWNFTKFLINREGVPVARFAPSTTPEKLENAISDEIR
jgi:glutathione peroxidase